MSVVRTRHWPALVAATAIVVACAICAGNATAQKNQGPPNALQGFSQNRDEPVKIRAAALELRVVTQKDQNATGDAATFNMRENTVTLVGNVVVTRGADVLRGQRLVVDLTSGVSKMDQGRVEGLFQSGPRNPPDPKGNPAEKSNTAEKSSTAEKR